MSVPLWDSPQGRRETRREKHRREKADKRLNVAVDLELARMGIEARAVAAAVRLNAEDVQAKLTAARWAAEPLEGAEGYLKLREAFTGVLLAEGVNMDDLELRFTWSPQSKELGIAVAPTADAAKRARDAVLFRQPKLKAV